MVKLIKIIFAFLWKKKFLLFLFSFFMSAFFALRFPWGDVLEKVIRQSQKNMPVPIEFEKVRMKVFPPGVKFYNLSTQLPSIKEPLVLDAFTFSMDIPKWLAFKTAWKLKGVKEASSFNISFWNEKKVIDDVEDSILFVNGSSLLDISLLNLMLPRVNSKGKVDVKIVYEGDIKNIEEIKAVLNFKSSTPLEMLKSYVETNIGVLDLPPVKWSQAEGVLRLKEGDLIVESLSLGSDTDKLHIEVRGSVELNYVYGRLRLGSYDFQTKIDISKDLNLRLIDLLLAKTKEVVGNRYVYKARINGRGSGAPNIEKLSEF